METCEDAVLCSRVVSGACVGGAGVVMWFGLLSGLVLCVFVGVYLLS
jgi:hypothetical protein